MATTITNLKRLLQSSKRHIARADVSTSILTREADQVHKSMRSSRIRQLSSRIDHEKLKEKNEDRELAILTDETKKLADLIIASKNDAFSENSLLNDKHVPHSYAERRALSQAITLLESQAPHKQKQANALLMYLQQNSAPKSSLRIGIAGAPGAGKSTLVEALGTHMLSLQQGKNAKENQSTTLFVPHRLAVVCVDPSSVVTGGSILGDKTRMTKLSAHHRAYVRPAPSVSGTLGGLAGESTNAIVQLLTDHAGYDTCLIETVGLGQSEVDVAQTVDITVLLIPPGGGDALQGAKKGILEVADIVCVTKADGELQSTAQTTAADYQGALQLIRTTSPRSSSCHDSTKSHNKVLLTSSESGLGLFELWDAILSLRKERIASGEWQQRRQSQSQFWMWKSFRTLVQQRVQQQLQLDKTEHLTHLPPRVAASRLLEQVFPSQP